MTLPTSYILMVLLAAVRLGAVIMVAPVFGARNIPAPVKIGAAVVITVALFPPGTPAVAVPEALLPFGLLLIRELAVGVLAGFAILLVFIAVQMAASLVGVQIGFGLAGVLDPTFQQASSPLEQLYNLLAVLIFLGADLHHVVLLGVVRLFTILPLGVWSLGEAGLAGLVTLFAGVMVVAVEIALPLLGALFLTDFALGVVGRFIPQMNVFFVGMPVKAGVGLLVLALALPFLVLRIEGLLAGAPQGLRLVLPFVVSSVEP